MTAETEQAVIVFRRLVSLSPLPPERPCPLARGGGLCYHYKARA